jgi:magnesium chelatase family protein
MIKFPYFRYPLNQYFSRYRQYYFVPQTIIMLIKTYGSAVFGVNAVIITIEVNIVNGLHFFIVGLPDVAVKESQQRIESAIKSNGYDMPKRKVIINLAPADIKKEGSAYDLPMVISILAATGQATCLNLDQYIIMGELSLDGGVRPIKGALPIAIEARKRGFKGFILPRQNAREAAVVNELDVYGVDSMNEALAFLAGELEIEPTFVDTRNDFFTNISDYREDFIDVKGQENVKRAMEVAASGGHNLIMIGAPGSGKTMLAKRLPSILPPLSLNEALETTKIHSVAGKIARDASLMTTRPFRSPHHTISDVALVGGGSFPQPGEISLAHNGVLFLDELPEFRRTVLEVMRQPLEDRNIIISRSRFSIEYPASFMLIASMNPCPCGYYNHPEKECVCLPGAVQKYLNKISGPLLDRIDIHIEVVPVPFDKLSEQRPAEKSETVRYRVLKARMVQQKRFSQHPGIHCNAMMTPQLLREYGVLNDAGHSLLKNAMAKLGLSARAFDRILKVSRTIADLEESESIQPAHVAEAIQYRSLDRENWAG